MSAPGVAAANIEGAVVFSPESFLPRYAMANLTVHILGRAFSLLEVNLFDICLYFPQNMKIKTDPIYYLVSKKAAT